ncbi:hypothetical protein LCGC14_2337380, partial [marine sediment metagenome]
LLRWPSPPCRQQETDGATGIRAGLAPAIAKGGTKTIVPRAVSGALAPIAGFEWVVGLTIKETIGRVAGAVFTKAVQEATRRELVRAARIKGVILPKETQRALLETYRQAFEQHLAKELASWTERQGVQLSAEVGNKAIDFIIERAAPKWASVRMINALGKEAITPLLIRDAARTAAEQAIRPLSTLLERATEKVKPITREVPPTVTPVEAVPEVAGIKPIIKDTNLQTAYDNVIKSLPPEISSEIDNVARVRLVEDIEGRGGNVVELANRRADIVIEKGEDLESTLRHELLHAYLLKHPEKITDKGFFGLENTIRKLKQSIKAGTFTQEVEPPTVTPVEAVPQVLRELPLGVTPEPVVSTAIPGAEALLPAPANKATFPQLRRGHQIAAEKQFISEKGKVKPQYRRLAQVMTGKKSMAKMTEEEASTFIEALERLPEPSYKEGKLVPPSIPTSTKIVPENYFNMKFKQPTPARLFTSQTSYSQKLGVKPLIEPLELAKQRMDLERVAFDNVITQKIQRIDKIGGTSLSEKAVAKLRNEPTPAVATFRDLLNKYEDAPAFL